MEVYCTRPGCSRPQNHFPDLDNRATLKTVQQKYCTTCGMPLILIGRYLPSRLLGQGGFGAAYLARDRYTPKMRQCVVKQFQPAGDLGQRELEIAQDLFNREAEVLEELGNTHPQIPDLFAFFPLIVPGGQAGKQDEFFYLVQEFIDGQDLEAELAQKGKFSEAEVVEVLGEILKVLKFVHERGAIHRDIKLSNIMRDRKGKLYLLDFGAVKQVTKGAGGGTGRSTGIYSMGFAPPEQMSGSTVYPSTDLYALAVTCVVLLSGQQPEDLYDSYNNRWNWKSQVRVNSRLATVLDKMLASAPNRRFQSAAAVMAALAPPQQAASTSGPGSMTSRPGRRKPPAAQAARPSAPAPPPPPTPSAPPQTARSAAPSPPHARPVPSPQARPQAPAGKASLSLTELLSGAAFTGFEGGAIFFGITQLTDAQGSLVAAGICFLVVAGLIFAQWRRLVEVQERLAILGITLAIVLGGAFFQGKQASIVFGIILVAIFAGLLAVAFTVLFRLVYNLLARFM